VVSEEDSFVPKETSLASFVDEEDKSPASPPPPGVGPLSLGERMVLESLRKMSVSSKSATVGKVCVL